MQENKQPIPWPLWASIFVLLFAWNMGASRLANPFTQVKGQDATQYQLLARNRLQGNDHVGDSAYTVRDEGWHPMWRPGLVWVEQMLAGRVGSVRQASKIASGIGVTLFQFLLLVLAYRCFSWRETTLLLLVLLSPLGAGATFLDLAVFQGPEAWAGACLLAGLLLLVVAMQNENTASAWPWCALIGGAVAGGAELFRTGNLLLVLVPCLVYLVVFAYRRRWAEVRIVVGFLMVFTTTLYASGRIVPSPINKTVVNFEHNRAETEGHLVTQDHSPLGFQCYSVGGLELAPGSHRSIYDESVASSHGASTVDYVVNNASYIGRLYSRRLWEVLSSGGWGLRQMIRLPVVIAFLVGVGFLVFGREPEDLHTSAFAAGALAQYLGPIALLVGMYETHYLYLVLPFVLLVAVRGAIRLGEVALQGLRSQPKLQLAPKDFRLALSVGVLGLVVHSLFFYSTFLHWLSRSERYSVAQQHYVDQLDLTGKRVACRNMSWFVDRDVETALLPYGSVEDLEGFAISHKIDGFLIWTEEPLLLFHANPIGTVEEWDRALAESELVDSPTQSGGWRWYPIDPKKGRIANTSTCGPTAIRRFSRCRTSSTTRCGRARLRSGLTPLHFECLFEREQYPEDLTEKNIELNAAPATRRHLLDFLAAIEKRGRPIADIEDGHISTASCILANVSMQLSGRPLRYDPKKQAVVGDEEATKLLQRPYRKPWKHPSAG